MRTHLVRPSAIVGAVVAAVSSAGYSNAQPVLDCAGSAVSYVGNQVQDFVIPEVVGQLQLTVRGADGGDASYTGGGGTTHTRLGGDGATAVIICVIGNGPNQIAPGGTIRFIIGEKGENDHDPFTPLIPGSAWAGGGGGSGVLYLPPGETDWNNAIILAAAGGGGGGVSSSASGSSLGGNARANECGGDNFYENGVGQNPGGFSLGGCGGAGGAGQGSGFPGAGGGALSAAIHCDSGGAGKAGFPNGGAGGAAGNRAEGGWGFGGGGVAGADGGGGGGYSGGGAGTSESAWTGGAGGGSYLNTDYAIFANWSTGNANQENGNGSYFFITSPPNSSHLGAIALVEDVPEDGSLCGVSFTGINFCGQNINADADLWYTFKNEAACPVDLTIAIDSSIDLFAYDSIFVVGGDPEIDLNTCRGQSAAGVWSAPLGPGETVFLRVTGADATEFTLTPTTEFVQGLADCDNDGIPNLCDPSNDCPPSNDTKNNAIVLGDGSSVAYDAVFATRQVAASCDALPNLAVDMWYSFTAPTGGQLIVRNISDFGPGVESNTSLSIFDDQLNELECDFFRNHSERFGDFDSVALWSMRAGETVCVRLGVIPAGGVFSGIVEAEFDETYTNDRCGTASVVAAPAPGETITVPFDLALAQRNESLQASCEPLTTRHDAWWTYQADRNGPVIFGTVEPDWTISLHNACDGAEIACDSTAGDGVVSLQHLMTVGQKVFVRASDRDPDVGTLTVTVPLACPCDWNADGNLNDQDFFDWANDYFSQAGPQGQFDFNNDGFENDQDWFDFTNCFFSPPAGC